ncbi:MAG: S9 family peptidase, partial [Chitinophagaceae bacterium]
MRFFLLCFFLGSASILFAQHGNEAMKVTDMLKIKSVNAISLNKDGSQAIVGLTTIEPETDNKAEYRYNSQLWLAATDGNSAPRMLTARENASQAVWSPDGKQLVFV